LIRIIEGFSNKAGDEDPSGAVKVGLVTNSLRAILCENETLNDIAFVVDIPLVWELPPLGLTFIELHCRKDNVQLGFR
jgi:hypothetical protein